MTTASPPARISGIREKVMAAEWVARKIEHGDDDILSIDGVSLYAIR